MKWRAFVLCAMICIAALSPHLGYAKAPNANWKNLVDGLAECKILDDQLACLNGAAEQYSDAFETGGWDVDFTVLSAQPLPKEFQPERYDDATESDTLPENLQGARMIFVSDDGYLEGNFFVRLPEDMRAKSLEEVEGVLILREWSTARTDYIGAAFNRHYGVYCKMIGSDELYLLFSWTTTPPHAGYGTLSGEKVEQSELWEKIRRVLLHAFTINDAFGRLTFQITGHSCYLSVVEGDRKVLTIPAFADDYPVIGVADCDLRSQCPSLEKVELSENLTWIGADAFRECAGLVEINFPSTLVSIDSRAFELCHSIRALQFNEGLKSIGDRAFQGCTNLSEVDLPSTLEILEEGNLENCQVPWLVVPEGITKLFTGFLANSYTLCTYIPASVTEIDGGYVLNYGSTAIYAPKGSYAEEFAREYNYDYVPCDNPAEMPRPVLYREGDWLYSDYNGQTVLMHYFGEDIPLNRFYEGSTIIVPSELGGHPVNRIWSFAIYMREEKCAVLPDTVIRLDSYALQAHPFYSASFNLVCIPASVIELRCIHNFYPINQSNGTLIVFAPEGSVAQQFAQEHELLWIQWEPGDPIPNISDYS